MTALQESVPNFTLGATDERVISSLCGAAGAAGAALLDRSHDPDHGRLVLTLGLPARGAVEAAFATLAIAVELIDLGEQRGVHPRRGVADVFPFVPLGSATLASSRELARQLGERVWSELRVPVHFYGAAASAPRTLAEIRSAAPPPPDLGDRPHPTAGMASIGARPPLVAYNLILDGLDLAAARVLARSLRESAGGVRGIQALAFQVTAGVQLSMNLTRLEECTPARALAEAGNRLPGSASVRLEELVGLCPAAAAEGCPAADGRLLEARLAGSAARAAAAWCAARADHSEEIRRLGERLAVEARSLDSLSFADALSGAERAAALRRVLRAGRVATPDADSLLAVAAEGLRGALPADVLRAFPERVSALDRWLSEA